MHSLFIPLTAFALAQFAPNQQPGAGWTVAPNRIESTVTQPNGDWNSFDNKGATSSRRGDVLLRSDGSGCSYGNGVKNCWK